MLNSVSPSLLLSLISPPCAFTMSYARLNPNPVPWPVGLVVKKGWKILSLMESGIPGPLSETRISTTPLPTCPTRTSGRASADGEYFVETTTSGCSTPETAYNALLTRLNNTLPMSWGITHLRQVRIQVGFDGCIE